MAAAPHRVRISGPYDGAGVIDSVVPASDNTVAATAGDVVQLNANEIGIAAHTFAVGERARYIKGGVRVEADNGMTAGIVGTETFERDSTLLWDTTAGQFSGTGDIKCGTVREKKVISGSVTALEFHLMPAGMLP